jgi:hypothetical protein
MACSTCADARTGRPCSSQVYQVTPTVASSATSSRRRPGVRRRSVGRMPTSSGLIRSRRLRRKAANSRRRASSLVPAVAPDVPAAAPPAPADSDISNMVSPCPSP